MGAAEQMQRHPTFSAAPIRGLMGVGDRCCPKVRGLTLGYIPAPAFAGWKMLSVLRLWLDFGTTEIIIRRSPKDWLPDACSSVVRLGLARSGYQGAFETQRG